MTRMIHYVVKSDSRALKIARFGLILGLMCLFSANGQNMPDKGIMELLGRVKTVRREVASLSRQNDKWVETRRVPREISTYDTTGKLADSVFFSPDGSVFRKQISHYDERGRLTEYTIYDCDGSLLSLSRKHVTTYNNKDNITEAADYNADGTLLFKSVYDYDDRSRKSIEVLYSSDGSPSSKTIRIWDDRGRVIQAAYHNADGSLQEKIVCIYASGHKRIEMGRYILRTYSGYLPVNNILLIAPNSSKSSPQPNRNFEQLDGR